MIFIDKKTYFFSAVLLMVGLMTGCGQHTPDKNTLIIGLNSGYPPYEVLNQNGELEGFDIDLAHAIGAKLNKKIVIKDLAFDTLIMDLGQGIDMIISGMSITQQRLELLHMIHYQGNPLTHLSLIFWQHIPDGISSLQDLEKYPDAVLCVQAGTIQEQVAKLYPSIQLKYLDIPQSVMDVMYGKSFTALLENPVADGIKEKHPDIKIVRIPLPIQKHTLGNGIAISKKNSDLASQVEKIVSDLKHDGTIANLEKKWFKESGHDMH